MASSSATADAQGHWHASLPALPAGGPYRLEAGSAGGATQSVEDLLIGEVWLCSGQSNMELQVKRALDSRSEILNANHPTIRLMTIAQGGAAVPQSRFPATPRWQAVTPASLELGLLNEEDVAWINGQPVGAQFGFAGHRLYRLQKGALHPGETIITLAVYCSYRGCGMLPGEFRRGLLFDDHSRAKITAWLFHRPGTMPTAMQRVPWGSIPGLGVAYNATIAPLGDYGLAGAIWYQGESNTGDGAAYRPLLKALMADWRRQFRADLPLLIVQLPNYGAPPSHPGPSGWAELREAQRQVVAADPHAALAVTIDSGDRYDIHRANKQELGRRLAALARHKSNFRGGPYPPQF